MRAAVSRLEGHGGGADRHTRKDLQKVLDMGVVEGATQAVNQVDALLAGS